MNKKELIFLKGVGKKYTDNHIFNSAHKKIINEYKPPVSGQPCLFTVCSWGKPYRQSYIHYFILRSLINAGFFNKLQLVIVTNAGVVPYDLSDNYPYFAYDWDPLLETPKIKTIYVEVLSKRLLEFLDAKEQFYKSFYCYLRYNSESYQAIRNVEKILKIEIPNLALHESNISEIDISQVSLNYYEDHDLFLITEKNLNNLIRKLKRLV